MTKTQIAQGDLCLYKSDGSALTSGDILRALSEATSRYDCDHPYCHPGIHPTRSSQHEIYVSEDCKLAVDALHPHVRWTVCEVRP